MNKTYGFISGGHPISSSKFIIKYTSILDEILDDPNASILLTDFRESDIFLARYLKEQQYRNATLYHVGSFPRINIAKLPTKEYETVKDVKDAIIKKSDTIIRI